MKITQETDYALRIVDYLSENVGEVIGSSKISERLVIPLRFTLKILRKLNLAGITKANRGVNGGYYLKEKPEDITYRDVIRAIEGEMYINKCLEDEGFCNRGFASRCKVHKNLVELQEALDKKLDAYNFGEK